MKRLAVIGAGVSGLGAARFLHRKFELSIFEAGSYAGGHACTVDFDTSAGSAPVDTGFMVFNHATYPNLLRLFNALRVPTVRTDMSFGVRHDARNLEYSGSSLNQLFAQRANIFSPSFWRMLLQIDRFNREALAALKDESIAALSLGEYVRRGGYGEDFFQLYLVPMSSAIWSTPPEKMLSFPARTLLRFFHNHGFLGMHTQHPWWTVVGGSKTYVEALIAPFRDRIRLNAPVFSVQRGPKGIVVSSSAGTETFDQVLFACHPPTTLALLGGAATASERAVLAPFQYQANKATLHSDTSVLPRRALARSSWNYLLTKPGCNQNSTTAEDLSVSTHYLMTRLQAIPGPRSCIVSINGRELIRPDSVQRRFDYEHPLFDRAAIAAQDSVEALNRSAHGTTETYFAGAWRRYGFHEDGFTSGISAAAEILGGDPWGEL